MFACIDVELRGELRREVRAVPNDIPTVGLGVGCLFGLGKWASSWAAVDVCACRLEKERHSTLDDLAVLVDTEEVEEREKERRKQR